MFIPGASGHTEDRCFIAHPCKHCGMCTSKSVADVLTNYMTMTKPCFRAFASWCTGGRHRSERCYKVHLCSICGKIGHMENRFQHFSLLYRLA